MAAFTPARRAALSALRGVRGGALADRAFPAAARDLEARDRAWAHELVYGTLRLRGRIDHRIARHATRPLSAIDPDILDVLRLATYELCDMDGVPDYAAVSQNVELAKSINRGAAGFVNAVLRGLRRSGSASTFPGIEEDAVGHLSTWGSHPAWLVERWIERFGVTAVKRLVEFDNTRPPTYIRILVGDVDAAKDRLEAAGIVTERVARRPRSLCLVEGSVQDALDLVPAVVQDPAAGIVVDFVGSTDGLVLDMAAAPGGKTMSLIGAGAPFVVAADRSYRRLQRVVENRDRLERPAPAGFGPLPMAVVAADGRHPPFRPVPAILLDAPCTGTGTLRRHPDGKWRLQPRDVDALTSLQAELLDAAAQVVQPGGLLVYATCSLEPEENEQQVERFLEKHTEFRLEPGTGAFAAEDGTLRVLPHEHGFDGAYAARLRREGGHAG